MTEIVKNIGKQRDYAFKYLTVSFPLLLITLHYWAKLLSLATQNIRVMRHYWCHPSGAYAWGIGKRVWIPKTISAWDPSLEELHGKLPAGCSQSNSSLPGTLDCRGCGPGTLHRSVPPCPSGIVSSVLCAWAANTALARPSYMPSREKLSSPPHFFPKELSFQMLLRFFIN